MGSGPWITRGYAIQRCAHGDASTRRQRSSLRSNQEIPAFFRGPTIDVATESEACAGTGPRNPVPSVRPKFPWLR